MKHLIFILALCVSFSSLSFAQGNVILTDSSYIKSQPEDDTRFENNTPAVDPYKSPEFRMGLAYSSMSGSGITFSYRPIRALKFNLAGYSLYDERSSGELSFTGSVGGSLDLMLYYFKSGNFFLAFAWNYFQENTRSAVNEKEVKKISVNSGLGIGIEFLAMQKVSFSFELGWNLIKSQSDAAASSTSDYYNPYPSQNNPVSGGMSVTVIF